MLDWNGLECNGVPPLQKWCDERVAKKSGIYSSLMNSASVNVVSLWGYVNIYSQENDVKKFLLS